MKTDLSTTGYTTAGSLARAKKDPLAKAGAAMVDPKLAKNLPSPDYKLDLSMPSLPPLPSIPTPPAPSVQVRPKIEPELVKELKEDMAKETAKIAEKEIKAGSVKKPAILFVKGWDVLSSPSKSETGYAGMAQIADSIDGAKVFKYSDKKAILEEIRKTNPHEPIILIGHSFGGDTVVDVANELDSLEHKFRPVDLLVTMDAIGFNNDIIPQNVKKHLNVFGEKSFLLNDGPHVARRHEMTDVKNILSPLDHTDLDDDKEIQFEVVSLIQKALNRA